MQYGLNRKTRHHLIIGAINPTAACAFPLQSGINGKNPQEIRRV